MNIVQIRPRGQVTIPKSIRQQAGVNDSTTFNIKTEFGNIIFEQVSVDPYPTRDYSIHEINDFVAEDKLSNVESSKLRSIIN